MKIQNVLAADAVGHLSTAGDFMQSLEKRKPINPLGGCVRFLVNIGRYSAFTDYSIAPSFHSTLNQSVSQIDSLPENEIYQASDSFVDLPLYDDNNKHDCIKCGCKKVTINVSGMKFETSERTLNRLPNTLLGDPNRREEFWDEKRQEYFFDRHRPSFSAVLYYYQSGGILQRPLEVPSDVFVDELLFYGISLSAIDKLRKTEGYLPENKEVLPDDKLKRTIWLLFQYPSSSYSAKAISLITISVIALSVIGLCVETLPSMRAKYGCGLYTNHTLIQSGRPKKKYSLFQGPFFVIETVCVFWFSVEYVFRVSSCPNLLHFLLDFLNTVDLLAIVPYYFVLLLHRVIPDLCSADSYISMLSIIRCVRIVRVFKLVKHFTSLRVLGATIRACHKILMTFFLLFIMIMIAFASLLYVVESDLINKHFESIPASFWYVVITMTTVGYGDITPNTIMGRVIGTMCVISGVLVIALTLPMIVTHFTRFYRQATGRLTTREDYLLLTQQRH